MGDDRGAHAVRVRVCYSGDVQGVGFRWRAVDAASGFQVTGYVRNLPDGRVELVAEGVQLELERLLAAVRARMRGLVEREEASWLSWTGEFRGFSVRR